MSAGSRALRAIAADDTHASFAAFVREHGDAVWRCLHALGLPSPVIDDAAQDVFLVAFRQWASYDDRGLPRPWLFAISRRVASNYRRARRHEVADEPEIAATDLDVEDALACREARALVDAFLQRLPEERRLVFYLSDVEGWSAPEVAEALVLKLNTVYSRLRRARAQFDRYLKTKGVRS
jgi:RNA polymerase sigma-70 factor (ECF subfamily)